MAGVLPTNLKYESYEESIATYVGLARGMFDGRYDADELTIEQVVSHTDPDRNDGIYMGIPGMAVLWLPCDEQPCNAPAWN